MHVMFYRNCLNPLCRRTQSKMLWYPTLTTAWEVYRAELTKPCRAWILRLCWTLWPIKRLYVPTPCLCDAISCSVWSEANAYDSSSSNSCNNNNLPLLNNHRCWLLESCARIILWTFGSVSIWWWTNRFYIIEHLFKCGRSCGRNILYSWLNYSI